jgi:trigger factor
MRSHAEFNPEENSARLYLEFRADELVPYEEAAVRDIQRSVRMPGFRQGKVPRQVLLARLGPGAVRVEAIEKAVEEAYEAALADNGLDPIGQPTLEIVEGKESGDAKVAIDLKLRPRVTVNGWDSLEIEVPSPLVTDDDVSKVIESFREQLATVKEVDRPAQSGDQVMVNVIEVDPEGNETITTPYLSIRLGKQELEGEEALIGATTGAKVEVTGDSSEQEGPKRMLEVLAVRELELPEADDALASQVSEFQTLKELKADIRKTFADRRRSEAQRVLERELVRHILDITEPKEVPKELVEPAYRKELTDFGSLLDNTGLSLKRYLEMSQQTQQDLAGSLGAKAAQEVLLDLALRAIAYDAALEVEDAEMEEVVERLRAQGMTESDLERPLQRQRIMVDILKQKAYQSVLRAARIKDTEGNQVTLKDLGVDIEDARQDDQEDSDSAENGEQTVSEPEAGID